MSKSHAKSSVKWLASSYYHAKGLTKKLSDSFYNEDFVNGTTEFYNLIRERLLLNSLVLDLGAGKGDNADADIRSLDDTPFVRVGLDIDKDFRNNPDLDHKIVGSSEKLPFYFGAFDLVFADSVMEHIENPEATVAEVYRSMKKGGYFIFHTNNLHHYATIISRLTGQWMHAKFVKNFMHVEKKLEPYITLYRFNSSKKITVSMDLAGFRQVNLLYVEKEPAYLMFNCIALVFGIIFERVVNRFDCLRELRADFFVVCQK